MYMLPMANKSAATGPFLNKSGVTLIELMVVIMLLGVGFLVSILSFGSIQKSIQFSKGRTLAANIAQEKMQIIMQKSYYEVLVTTAPQFQVEPSSTVIYDPGYFPPETIREGGMTFTRYTYIQVAQENPTTHTIITLDPTTPDTGMRQITVTVVWNTDSGDRLLSVQNVLNNPNTVMSNSILQGVVKDSTTLAAIPYALVDAAENVGWRDTASSSGTYLINLSPGTFDFQASAPGYYSQIVTLTVAPNGSTSTNFFLKAISTGTVNGSVWLDNHLVISQVVAATGTVAGGTAGQDIEYVELYNPTTGAIVLGNNVNPTTPNIALVLWDGANNSYIRRLYYVNSTIPSNGSYLISNTGNTPTPANTCNSFIVAGVTFTPDACWLYVTAPSHAFNCGTQPCSGSYIADAGGVSVANSSAYIVVPGNINPSHWPGARIDSVAWSDTASGHACPTGAAEGTCISSSNGLQAGEQYVRRTDTGTVSNIAFGPAYDANNNSIDFFDNPSLTVQPHATATTRPPLTGTPAAGAVVSVTDGLSTPSTAIILGNPPYAQFMVPGIATGTWSVFADSGSASVEIDNVSVVWNSTTSIPNAFTSPVWQNSSNNIVLSTNGVIGMISGKVTDALGNVISGGISVTAGNTSVTTNASGMYFLRLSTGMYDVIANPGNANSLYASVTQPAVNVLLSDVTSNVDFLLPQGGKINGWLTRDGINPLPSVTVVAFDSDGVPRGNVVSDSNGNFILINLTTGAYTVQPVLDPKETSSPISAAATVTPGNTVWSSSFTVIGAMGQVAGIVKAGGQPINSGVLIVASTATVPNPLPALSSATLVAAVFYAASSLEDGTYSMDVRGSTTSLYNIAAFYTTLSGSTPITSTRTVSGITVTAGQTTSGVNFSW